MNWHPNLAGFKLSFALYFVCCGICGGVPRVSAILGQEPLDPQSSAELQQLVADAARQGDAARGISIYASPKSACISCHRLGQIGGTIGPDLSTIGMQRNSTQLAESVLWPNLHVEPQFQVHQLLTTDGEVVRGFKVREDADAVVLRDPATGAERSVATSQIEQRKVAKSLMPDELSHQWSRTEKLDLIAFLSDLGRFEKVRPEVIATILSHATPHEPAKFQFTREPLDKVAWPNWQARVNHDRIYDFYSKQADYFRSRPNEPFLMEFPGLDGGDLGHWGNQNEQTWESNWWNEATLGSVQCGVFHGPNRRVVPRGVCVRLGDHGELSACFDPEQLTYPTVWRGDFLEFSTVRHGFLNGLIPKGELINEPSANTSPNRPFRYRGFYRVGARTIFSYFYGEEEYLDAPWVENGHFVREVAPRATHSMRDSLIRSPRQWPETLSTEIKLGEQTPYAIDTIELPKGNPWKSPMFCGDHDFLPDGSALIVTMQGDVWRVSGLVSASPSAPSRTATWTRFASGLHHALGIRVLNSSIFVIGRDQLTRLHDLNSDGEADFYEAYSTALETSPAGHDFICGLQLDSSGDFYTASGNQGLVRISSDGSSASVVANGFRNPDGLGIYPDGMLTVPCSEGDWTPASMICAVPKSPAGASVPFFGYRGRQFVNQPITKPELPMVYLPRGLDNSAGGQVYVDSHRWGPLQGNMVHLSFGTGSHLLLLRDFVDGQVQGAVVPLAGEFQSGVHRGRFSPADGQLYVSGMAGWGSYTVDVGCFQRVRYTGTLVQIPIGFHVHRNGIAIRFPEPLDEKIVRESERHFAQAWNYRYGAAYGSSEYSTRSYGAAGHDRLNITSSHVFDDGQTLFLEIPDLVPYNQLHLRLEVSEGKRIDMFATCNKLDRQRVDFQGAMPVVNRLNRHPLDVDMELAARRIKNPWGKPIEGARKVRIEAGKNLTFHPRSFSAKTGEVLALTLANPDTVPHNWALVVPGALASIGEAANRLVAAPEGFIQQYVPQSKEVVCYSDIVEPHQEFTIYFRVPEQPGRYPFLCTFPGHWMVMNGEMIVSR